VRSGLRRPPRLPAHFESTALGGYPGRVAEPWLPPAQHEAERECRPRCGADPL